MPNHFATRRSTLFSRVMGAGREKQPCRSAFRAKRHVIPRINPSLLRRRSTSAQWDQRAPFPTSSTATGTPPSVLMKGSPENDLVEKNPAGWFCRPSCRSSDCPCSPDGWRHGRHQPGRGDEQPHRAPATRCAKSKQTTINWRRFLAEGRLLELDISPETGMIVSSNSKRTMTMMIRGINP
jgi:hypothetical protein